MQGIAGWDGSSYREVAVDTNGRLQGTGIGESVRRTSAFSTTTALANTAKYSSATIDADEYARVSGLVFADQAGTAAILASFDNASYHTVWNASVSANVAQGFDVAVYAPFVQGSYTNSATTQTSFAFAGYLVGR
jgi:hypothetical protein